MRHFRSLLLLGLLFAAFALPAVAQGYTVSFNQIVEHPALDAVRKGVQDALADEHLDVSYNVHIAQGNISTANLIARQILGENPDVIVPIATPTAQACAQITRDKPIVFAVVSDPVGAGLVKSFDHPGANITGTSDMSPVDKQLELALKIVPGIQRIGVIYNSGESNSVAIVNVLKKDAAARQMTVVEATVANSAGVYPAAKSLVGKVDAIYIPTDNTVVSAFEAVTKVATESKIPLFAADTDSVARGAIAALAVDYYLIGKQTGRMVARILRGAKPAEMPVETLDELLIHLNPKAAAGMGVTIPDAVLKQANKIVE